MNIAVAVCVLSVLILTNCGLSQATKWLRGEYDYTKEFKERITEVSDKDKQTPTSTGDVVQLNKAGSFKPCYKHLQHLLKNKPRPKTFVPLCGIDGFYAPLQCHSGYCWCVDGLGKEKKGTRVNGLTDCGLQSVKQPCIRHRSRALSYSSSIGTTRRPVFIPRCNENGYYSSLQCLVRNIRCWCVDEQGKEKKGTRARGIAKCEDKVHSSISEVVDWFSVPDKPRKVNPCLRHKRRLEKYIPNVRRKFYDPNCDKDGMYDKKQCHGRYCWCADREGKRIKGSRSKNKGSVECETRLPSGPTRKDCIITRLEAIKTSLFMKPMMPLCDSSGNYAPLQCDVYKGYCWCADEVGKEIPGSKTKRTPNCFSKVISKSGKGPCHLHKWYIQKLPTTNLTHIPSCKKNGFFQQKQCSHNNDYCWCVDHVGTEIKKTLTFGILRCPDDKPLNLTDVFTANKPPRTTPCIRHRDKVLKHMASRRRRKPFNPTCDENGKYNAKQCHHRHCWCVKSNGNMIPKTRKKGDVNCDLASLTKKHCRTERLKALEISMFLKPFVPLCELNGKYSPVQCDVYNGKCWCVNPDGKEIPGSKTKRIPNCFSNVFNTVQDGPCHMLQSYIEKLSFTKYVHKPKCEENGFFQPSQCNRNKGYCWCVMHDGTEIGESIMFGKPRCHEKPAPAVPKERGPCEDHLYHIKNLISDREVYTPACDENGFFVPLQCNNLTGYCWCADRYGVVVRETRTKGTPVCGEKALKPCNALKTKDKEYTPVYTEEGYFAPLQCNVKRGNCWCVDKMGVKVPGTSTYQRPYCGTEIRSCELQRRLLFSTNQTETLVPSCDLHGYFSTIQCDVSSDECWCSDRGGNEILGSRTKETPECGQIPSPCEEHASRTSNYDYIFGVYVPQCDSKGYYKNIQCHEKTNVCWCSSRIGVEIPGTKTTGRPNCSEKRISR